MDGTQRHQCMIYEGAPSKHLRCIAELTITNLQAHKRCLYLNSPTMVAGLRSYLAAAGLNVAHEVNKGSLVLSSDSSHLVDGLFDVDRMLGMLADTVGRAMADGYAGLWATGDMTWELGSEKNFAKLMDYEIGLEKMFRSHLGLSGVCQYHQETLPDDVLGVALATHRAVYVNETLARLNPFYSAMPAAAVKELSASALKEALSRLRAAD